MHQAQKKARRAGKKTKPQGENAGGLLTATTGEWMSRLRKRRKQDRFRVASRVAHRAERDA